MRAKTVTNLKIDELIIESDRPVHIAQHSVAVEEVKEIVNGDYVFVQAKYGRWQLIGKTRHSRFLSIIIGHRLKKNTYGLITARPASRKERSFFKEITLQESN